MVEERQQRQKKSVVKTTSIVAAGCASVTAAIFTSKLGVAGTLIGTAMTSMVITLTSAILNAQLERASTKISGLPSTVRGRLSTQQVRVPGRPGAEPNPEPPERPSEQPRTEPLQHGRHSDGRQAGFLERLRSIPSRLKAMSPTTRRRVLISGVLAGVVATAIALSAITFGEAVVGKPLSSVVWSGSDAPQSASGQPSTSVGRLFGGAPGAGNQQYAPSGGGQQPAPGAGGQQYQQQPGAGGGQQPQNPSQQPAPQEDPSQQQPGVQQPAPSGQPGGQPQDQPQDQPKGQ